MAGRPQGIRFAKRTGAKIEDASRFVDRDDVFGAHVAGIAFAWLSARSDDPGPRDQRDLGRASRRSPIDDGYRFARIVSERNLDLGSRKAVARREGPEPRELFAHSREDLVTRDAVGDERSCQSYVQTGRCGIPVYGLVSARAGQ
jgi:hypothetical protein